MAAPVMSNKTTRLIFAGILAVVVLNIWFFVFESRHGEFESSLDTLAQKIPETSPAAPERETSAPPKFSKAVYRTYFDDRDRGLLVATRSTGAVWDSEDKETQRLRNLAHAQTTNEFVFFEISTYENQPAAMSPTDGSADSANEDGNIGTESPIIEYYGFQAAFEEFFSDLMKNIDEHKPSVNGINNDEHYRQSKDENRYVNRDGRIPVYGGHLREQYLNEPVRSFEYLKSFLRLSEDETRSLKNSHEKYMSAMKTSIPEQILKKGSQFGFMKGDGIVYLGGAKYDQLVLTSVSVLRSLGSKIPVEVIVPKRSDYNIDLCNIILPQLNGKCRVMEDFVPASVMSRIGGFQLKNVALLVSSFKNVLYLDADNVPVKNPDVLFVNEPFKSSRMVMWPDLWRRSTSPSFYEIAGIEVDKTHHARNSYFKGDGRGESSDPALISFHDLQGALPEASSETGQMMIDKEKHFPTLVLSMYYNFYGPDYFYPLFSQGAAGEGDKETFIAAAHKLGLPYYQVGEFNREFGPMGKNQKREYFGMGQYDPIIDHLQSTMPDRSSRAQTEYALDQEDDTKSNYDFHMYKSHSLMFLHANWPKFYLDELFEKNGFGRGPQDGQNKRRRLYSEHMIKETGGFDAELHIMRHIKQWACDARIELANVPGVGSDRRKKICEEVASQIKFLAGA